MELFAGHIKDFMGWVSKETRSVLGSLKTHEERVNGLAPIIGNKQLSRLNDKLLRAQTELKEASEELELAEKEMGLLVSLNSQKKQELELLYQERDLLLTALDDFPKYMAVLESETRVKKESGFLAASLSIAQMRKAAAEERLTTAEKTLRKMRNRQPNP